MARARAIQFCIVVLALSFAFEALLIARGGLESLGPLGVLLLMWVPGLLAIVFTRLDKKPLKSLGLGRGTARAWLLAFGVPLACGAFTYAAAVLAGWVHFAPPPDAVERGRATLGAWATGIPIQLLVGGAVGSVYGLGEELGWRGYLLPRLVEARVRFALPLSGLVWGVWHLPLILFGDYATSERPVVSAALFMGVVVLAAIFFGWLQLTSGSVFAPMVAHAVHNVVYQSVFDRWFAGPLEPYVAGEQGLFSIVAYGCVAALVVRAMRAAPVR